MNVDSPLRHKLHVVALFFSLCVVFGAVQVRLLQHHYDSESSIYYWVMMRALLDAQQLRIDNLGFDMLYGQIALLAPSILLPALQKWSHYLVGVISVAWLLTIWYRSLSRRGYTGLQCSLLLVVIGLNPALLWGATGGGTLAVSLLILYLLHSVILQVLYQGDIRSYIAAGLLMALYVVFDATAGYMLFVLLPLMVLFTPVKHLQLAPHSVYIILGLPLLLVVLSWLYFNWIFYGEPLAFYTSATSIFRGVSAEADRHAWLYAYGGEFFRPMSVGLIYIVVGFPALIYLLYMSYRRGRSVHASLALAYYPAVAIGLATFSHYLDTPLQISSLAIVIVMAEVVRHDAAGRFSFATLVLLLTLGIGMNWYLFSKDDNVQIRNWRVALIEEIPVNGADEDKLGAWLSQHRSSTLLDLHSGYRVVAARGDAREVVMNLADGYQRALRSGTPDVAQIVVPNPDSYAGEHDEVNRMFPTLYEQGLDGFELTYDEGGWRVYQKR